jgi:multimeric flavodoxin WrbA
VKIMTILGSPKMDGNTAAALSMFEEAVRGTHEIERVNLPELEVMGCQGCYACQEEPNEASCVIRDGATDVLRRIVDSDAVVYATPLFMWGFAAKIHALMERHISLVTGFSTARYRSLVEGKKMALLVTCGGPDGGNTDAIKQVFDGFVKFGNAKLVGKYIVAGATTPEEIEHKAAKVIRKMVADFGV